jgi:hypothetical protein
MISHLGNVMVMILDPEELHFLTGMTIHSFCGLLYKQPILFGLFVRLFSSHPLH